MRGNLERGTVKIKFRWPTILLGISLLILLPTNQAALGSDHRPPRIVLRAGGEPLQPGQLAASCWTRLGDEPGEVITECNGAVWDFPDAVNTKAEGFARVRIRKSQPPQELEIRRWRKVNQAQEPVGQGHKIDYELHPRLDATSNEIVSFDAVFSMPPRKGHLYLRVSGVWQDEDAAAGDQDASWTLHVKLR